VSDVLSEKCTHVLELGLEHRDHVFFDDYAFVVEIFDYVVMVGTIDADNDGFDGGIAFDKNASDCARHLGCAREVVESSYDRKAPPENLVELKGTGALHDAQTHLDD
jgi:hypothetical protein